MTEQEMVFGRDFTISQIKWHCGVSSAKAKGHNGRGRPRGSKNKTVTGGRN